MTSSIFWRIIIAVIVCIALYALIPPVFHVIGFPLSADLTAIFRICIAAIAALYILCGPTWPPVLR